MSKVKLVESSKKPLKLVEGKVLYGPFATLGTLNQNGRIYPDDVYIKAQEGIIDKLKSRRLLGELDHPLEYDEVRLANVSHVVTECEIKEVNGHKQIFGKVELLDTPSGRIAQALVEAGIPLGISSRGLGDTRETQAGTEVTDFQLITYDLVADPSFAEAILLTESKATKLKSRLDSIEKDLPTRELDGEVTSLRESIRRLRESVKVNTKVTKKVSKKLDETRVAKKNVTKTTKKYAVVNSRLIESVGNLVTEVETKKSQIRTIKGHMSDLQEGYNKLSFSNALLKRDYKSLQESNTKYKNYVSELSAKSSKLQEEVIELRKQLAVEKRGMTYDTVAPLLEGLTTTREINEKLDTLKHYNSSKGTTATSIAESLTKETRVISESTKLSKLVARV